MCFRWKSLVKSLCGAQKLPLCCKVISLAAFFFLTLALNSGVYLSKIHSGTGIIFLLFTVA